MDHFSEALNNLLVDTFRNILKVEQELIQQSGTNLTINELHLIESVAKNKDKGMSISDIANDMDISLPSVTVAINKLQAKGYVEKTKSENDGRVVYVMLTRLGSKMNAAHQFFHQSMVRSLVRDLTDEEQNAMIKGILKLDDFFKKKIHPVEDK